MEDISYGVMALLLCALYLPNLYFHSRVFVIFKYSRKGPVVLEKYIMFFHKGFMSLHCLRWWYDKHILCDAWRRVKNPSPFNILTMKMSKSFAGNPLLQVLNSDCMQHKIVWKSIIIMMLTDHNINYTIFSTVFWKGIKPIICSFNKHFTA